MISIEKSKKILNKNGANYTDEEIKIIRDYLYYLAEIDYLLFKSIQEKKLLQQEENQAEKTSLKNQSKN